jgi:hypothetical protein
MPSRDSFTAMRWMRLTSFAELKPDIWKPTPERASSSAEMLGRPAESGPVIVPLLSNMSWLIFSCSVMRPSNAASRASVPTGVSASATTLKRSSSATQVARTRVR